MKKSPEAKALQALAETRYKIRRKFGLKKSVPSPGNTSLKVAEGGEGGAVHDHHPFKLHSGCTGNSISTISIPSSRVVITPNIWQLYPETIWWDSAISNLAPDNPSSPRQDTRLLTLFLEVIHPITYGFYRLSSSKDRSWLLSRLVGDQALYSVSLSVSACFEHSLTQPPKTDSIGIYPKVRSLQNIAIHELQTRLNAFVTEKNPSLQDFICTGMRLLDVILNLITLEVFSMLQGHWETHYQAARTLLNYLETRSLPKDVDAIGPKVYPIDFTLSMTALDDQQRRSIEFCLMSFIWVDVIATATFGVSSYSPSAFDYLHLLEKGEIKPQRAMGCQGWIMATIVEIARLDQWKAMQHGQIHPSSATAEMGRRGIQLADKLKSGVEGLEKGGGQSTRSPDSDLEEDSRLVSILWAYAAQVFLQVTAFETEDTRPYIDQTFVNICLQKLEELPARLVIRVCWPYTIAGCMSTSESHGRFRRIVSRTMQKSQPIGMTWKGLMVMEECWRMRKIRGPTKIGWREAMESLGARILLI